MLVRNIYCEENAETCNMGLDYTLGHIHFCKPVANALR